ncbi:polysaccharide biosynthesis protein [Aestuariibacter halophilus]|uniref:Polysaccharide biosynthesis protein n=1 Tax=Fluctibacter halophilus TaxID=226011 RepID=A0ABS8GGN0_9ALTE|nr:nucleoside-diphosphate sugar epimerase/dehydratase [Aestuariibacter halophilus]MCC2618331.1 polysaccharide biosynthesis protein [Aestuariibacter halophilus]
MIQLRAIFDLHTKTKLLLEWLWDSAALFFALLFAYWIRIGMDSWNFTAIDWGVALANVLFAQSLLVLLGHYRHMIRFINLQAVNSIIIAVGCSTLYLYVAKWTLDVFMPATIPMIYFTVATLSIAAPRLLIQATAQASNYRVREKCIIYGATSTGRTLAASLRAGNDLLPVAFVDDKRAYQGKQIDGLIVAARKDIPELVKRHGVKKVLIAVNNSSQARRKELIRELEPYAIELLSIPNIQDIAAGKHRIDELREIKIEELLGREPVPPIEELLNVDIQGKTVMVTGAGGSIGSELCRQIAACQPSKMILFELSEFNLYNIETELRDKYPGLSIVTELASIQDSDVLRRVIGENRVQTIYHAAAYKHVPMVERSPAAGIRNNIFGTANVALIAAEFEVQKFVLVSTDKAVRPTNIMGATKRFAELFVQGIAELQEGTRYAIVRFGNVLGSSGSVVPLFRQQIQAGGPITVTHPDITRYFMTIPEAAQLVIQAGAMSQRGEVYVLDMGEPVKIIDLATQMAHLMGHRISLENPKQGDIALLFTGLRPGEKLYEELLIDDAETQTQHPRIMGANELKLDFSDVVMLLDQLNFLLIKGDEAGAIQLLRDAPLAYQPDSAAAGKSVA